MSTTSARLLATGLLACACDVADPGPGGGDGKADDLIGRKMDVEGVKTTSVESGIFVSEPTVLERDDGSLLIKTDELLHTYDDIVSITAFDEDYDGFIHGFVLDVRTPGGEWQRMNPVINDSAYAWTNVQVMERSTFTGYSISGDATRWEDAWQGLTADGVIRPAERQVRQDEPQGLELRVYPIPLWDFGDWAETGYRIEISFDRR
jgi:hypothetical protein